MTHTAAGVPVGSADDTRTAFPICPLCEAGCGLEATVAGEAVVRIRGNRRHVFSHGFLCPKGSTLKQLHEDPDRLRAPMVRRDGRHVEVTWDEAWQEVDRRLSSVIAEHGREALAVYIGNPTAHNMAAAMYLRPLLQALGTRNRFSASTVDQAPKQVAAGYLFGTPVSVAVPDLDHTDYVLMLGANPYASNGSLCTAPDFPGRLEAMRARGGRLVVVDPRRSRTAQAADEWVAIRPGTDAHLLMGMVHVLFAEGLADPGRHVAPWVEGIDELGPRAPSRSRPEATARGVRDRGGHGPSPRPGARRCADGGRVRPDRDLHPGLRHDGVVAGRRPQPPDRQPGSAGVGRCSRCRPPAVPRPGAARVAAAASGSAAAAPGSAGCPR